MFENSNPENNEETLGNEPQENEEEKIEEKGLELTYEKNEVQTETPVNFISGTSLDLSNMKSLSEDSLNIPQVTRTPRNSKVEIKDSQTKLILCVGLCVLDIVHLCEEYPSENDKQLLSSGYWQRGGNASNNCTVIKNLGGECEFLGVMSKSQAFSFLKDDCIEREIIIENCPMVNMYPPFSSILACKPTGTFTIIHTNLGFPILTFEHFKENIKLEKYSWIHFEARNPQETKPMLNMIRRFNADNADNQDFKCIQTSLELAKNDRSLLTLAMRCGLLFVGRSFATSLGWDSPKDTVYNLRQLISIMQLREEKTPDELDICFCCPHIVCPWGPQGCSILTSSYIYDHIPAPEVDEVVDAKGSGDTFVGSIIYAMNDLEMDLKDAVALGCQIAVYKMQHLGLDCIKSYSIEGNTIINPEW